jgi:hypothetical protein
MSYTTINKSSEHFNTITWSGTGSGKSETGVGFQPDLVWSKGRTLVGYNHYLVDAVRGSTKVIHSNLSDAEYTDSNGISSFDSDGYTFGTSNGYNNSSQTYVGWNWLGANGTASNTDGSITSTVSANTTSGFSIVSYTGTGANATVGHGLGSTPNVYIIKRKNGASTWLTYHSALGIGYHLGLNNTTAQNSNDSAFANNTAPDSSVVSLGTWGDLNGSGNTYVMYCFAEKTGYSKFGSYIGNQNNDGTFVYLGFKPAFVMVKRSSDTGNWQMFDNKRIGYNPLNYFLYPNLNNAEDTSNSQWLDLHSNGFKLRNTGTDTNRSGHTYIYMAFAEAPLVGTNNVPCTAR